MKLNYKKSHAFANGKSEGNPAACIYLAPDQQLSEAFMQEIAKEHKGFVSEVIYCTPLNNSTFQLRYFSSECEVEFCGHGTIACMYELVKNNQKLQTIPQITILTNKGELIVYNEFSTSNAVFITAPSPLYLPVLVHINAIAEHLQLSIESINNSFPIELIDAGLRTLIIPIKSLHETITIEPDEAKLKTFCLANQIDTILVFTTDVAKKSHKARTRVFAPKFGYLEDPATGSGNSAFGYYMLNHNLWHGEMFTIEQNNEIELYNIVQLKTINNKVLFGGSAILRIEGSYFI